MRFLKERVIRRVDGAINSRVNEVVDIADLYIIQGGSAAAQIAKEGAGKAGRVVRGAMQKGVEVTLQAATRVETALLRGTNGSAAPFEKLGKQSSSETTIYRMPQKPQ